MHEGGKKNLHPTKFKSNPRTFWNKFRAKTSFSWQTKQDRGVFQAEVAYTD